MTLLPVLSICAGDKFTVVIDAGHGGHDCGAIGATSYEKNLTLKYALELGRKIERNCPDVKVIYTRKRDVFIPLHERAEIANRNNADLFISVHINALGGGRISHGFQSYTLGTGQRTGAKGLKENVEVAKRENSVIFLEKDYKKQYKGAQNSAESDIMFEFIADKNREQSVELSRLMQREVCKAVGCVNGGPHQNNLAVLRLTSMPAVLLELGFISTPDEEAFLNTDRGLDSYTRGMYNAFIYYKNEHDHTVEVPMRRNYQPMSGPVGMKGWKYDKPLPKKDDETSEKTEPVKKPAKVKEQPRKKNKPKTERPEAKPVDKDAPVFKIQIMAGSSKLNVNGPLFKGLKGCERFEEGGKYRYTYGSSNNYNYIVRLRKQVLDKFPDAFIIAMKNGKQMNVNEGIKEFLANKRKR